MKKLGGIILLIAISLLSINLHMLEVKASTNISLNKEYGGTVDKQNPNNYYHFTLTESGRIHFKLDSAVSSEVYYRLSQEDTTITSYYLSGSPANPGKANIILDLEPGNYTLQLYSRYDNNAGNYNFSIQFEPSKSIDQEPNNGVAQAEALSFGKKKLGYLSWNDKDDYHKVTLEKSSILSMSLEGYLTNSTYYEVIDNDNNRIESYYVSSSNQNPGKVTKSYYLEPGDYFIRVYSRYDGYTGKYNLEVNSTPINTTETEPNNGTALAQPIEYGETNKGFIAWNDRDDYYSFHVNKKKDYTLFINSKLQNYTYVQVIDDKNNIVWSDYYNSSAVNPAVIEKKLTLDSGKHYIRVYARYDNYYGVYDVTILGDGITAFKDYKVGSYWTNSFAWGMKKNIIKGDLHALRLNPNNYITEAQWLAMLLRYSHNQKDATSGNWYDSYYKKARELGIETKQKPNDSLSRGAVAKMLVTVYEGKNVTEREAVDLLYKKGITTGVNPKLGQTFENFNPSGKLTRAHAITFMYRLYGN